MASLRETTKPSITIFLSHTANEQIEIREKGWLVNPVALAFENVFYRTSNGHLPSISKGKPLSLFLLFCPFWCARVVFFSGFGHGGGWVHRTPLKMLVGKRVLGFFFSSF